MRTYLSPTLNFISIIIVISASILLQRLVPSVLPYSRQPELFESDCRVIILPPLPNTDTGYLLKSPKPITKPGSMLGLDAEFYTITGYAIGDDYTPGTITTDGRKVRPGITVACPQELPLGTALYIETIGVRICEDRGSAIVGKRLDIAFDTPESALMFGTRWLAVAVIQ